MRENRRKNNGDSTYKTTHILAATYHKLQTLVPKQSLVNVLVKFDIQLIYFK